MSCFEQSEFVPDLGVLNQRILQQACDRLQWPYQIRGEELRVLQTHSSNRLHGEAALSIRKNRIQWNSYYLQDGRASAQQLESMYRLVLAEVRVAYAREVVVSAFRERGFRMVEDPSFSEGEEVKHRFFLKGRSQLKGESEPTAKIRVSILSDGTVQTDSNYIPEDIHLLADEAMAVIGTHLGTQRKIKPKKIPAKYRDKAFCKRTDVIQIRRTKS